MLYGYARTNNSNQELDHQFSSIIEVGVEKENIFIDKGSEDSAFQQMIQAVKQEDMIVIRPTDMLQILSFQAEQRMAYNKQRQAEGISQARQKGVKFGRPRKSLPDNFEELYRRFRNDEPISRLAKDCKDISESTLRLRLYERLEMDNNG